MNEPIGCALCGGNNHNADECKRFAEWMAVPELGKFIDWVWQLKQGRDALLAAQPAPVVPEGFKALLDRIVPRLDAGGPNPIDPEIHHCEWTLYQERERIHAEFAAAPAQGQQVECQECERLRAQLDDPDFPPKYSRRLIAELRAELSALKAQQYPLPDELYSGSKDWAGSTYAGRVEWLHTMYESSKREVAMLEEQALKAQQVGQEPVAYLVEGLGTVSLHYRKYPEWAHGDNSLTVTPLYTAPQPAPSQDVAVKDELELIRAVLNGYSPCMARNDALRAVGVLLAAHDKQSGVE